MGKWAILAIAVVAVGAFAAPGGTATPTREPLPAADFTLDGICAFSVDVAVLTNEQMLISFSDGRGLATGALEVELTNASDPSKSVVLNVPGPGVTTTSDDGSLLTGTGPWLLFFPPGALGAGSSGFLSYIVGRFTITSSPEGTAFEQQAGVSRDLCAELS